MKPKVLFTLAAVAAAGVGVAMLAKPKLDLVTGRSGKQWRVVMLGNSLGTKTYEVWAPAGSFGPHGELSVLRYSQSGSDTASRKIVGVGQGVPAEMQQAAASDFGLPYNAGGVLPLGTSG